MSNIPKLIQDILDKEIPPAEEIAPGIYRTNISADAMQTADAMQKVVDAAYGYPYAPEPLVRRTPGKGRYDLLSVNALWREACRLEHGATKYPERAWETVTDRSIFYDKALRHLCQWWEGDDSEDHLAAARVNIAFLIDMEERGT